MLKNDAKRVPKSAVFTLDLNADAGNNELGYIESNIAITRVMLVVDEAFNGTTPTITVTQAGDTHFTNADIASETVATSDLFTPVTGTIAPLFKATKTLWEAALVSGGSTTGSLKVVVEYIQLDTEPGLHSATNN